MVNTNSKDTFRCDKTVLNKGYYLFVFLLVFLFSQFSPNSIYAFDNKYVHPYIAVEGYKVWPNDASHEIYQYLGMNYNTSAGDCSWAGIGMSIREGAREEDDFDPIMGVCGDDLFHSWPSLGYNFWHHFYQTDWDEPYNGLKTGPIESEGSLAYAKKYWNWIKYYYPLDKEMAYWYLGRIAHLLADASVPAHVLNDPHGGSATGGDDSYEDYIMVNYTRWNHTDTSELTSLDITWTLNDLFWNLAQRTQYFPSDNRWGNIENAELYWFIGWPNTNGWIVDVIGDNYIEESNLRKIGDEIMPLAIQYTAALYRYFWHEFHTSIDCPKATVVLNETTFNAIGKLDGSMVELWEWDFDYDGNNFDDATGQEITHVFRQWGPKTIALRASASGKENEIVTREIYIKPYPIEVSLPDGFESLRRVFSTPESFHVIQYRWSFGDGSQPKDGRIQDYTYTDSGYYTVTLSLTLDDSSTIQSQETIFVGPGTRYIPGHTIYGHETWHSGGTYIVGGHIHVANGGKLTIEPGVIVKGGMLIVQGTLEATDVTFTWRDEQSEWYGIQFIGAESSASRLKGCVIEHVDGYLNNYRIIYIEDSSPTISGCTIQNSSAPHGIYISNGAPTIINTTISGRAYGISVSNNSSPAVTGCTITNNTMGVYIQSDSSGTYQENTITDNTYGIYAVYGTNNPIFTGNSYSNNSQGDLLVSGTIQAAVSWNDNGEYWNSSLTIAPGARLDITSGRIVKGGMLIVQGTLEATDVTFTWRDEQSEWYGIQFIGAESSASRLKGCVIEHVDGYLNNYRIIYIEDSSPTISGCTIQNSSAPHGIYISNGAPTIINTTISGRAYGISVSNNSSPAVTGCTITNNTMGVYIQSDSSGTYQENTITDNTYGIYAVYGTNNPIFTGNSYSNNSQGDLLVSGTIQAAVSWNDNGEYWNSSLTIAPGARLDITSGRIVKGGMLIVQGTLEATDVTFTWRDEQSEWYGIQFIGAESSASRLKGCVIEHVDGYLNNYRIIYIEDSSPTISGCTIQNSSAPHGIYISNGAPTIINTTISGRAYGISVSNNSSPAVTGCTITNNTRGIIISGNNRGVYQGNIIENNTSYGILNLGTAVVRARNNFWGDTTGPFDSSDDRNNGGWYNPNGLGDRVSDYVEYVPWIGDITDSDGDGMPDEWEIAHFEIITAANAITDNDNDGLLDRDEFLYSTDPQDSDSDDDRILDAWEVRNNLDPLKDDALDDFDLDSYCNLREFISESDPWDEQDIPNIIADFEPDDDVDGIDLFSFIEEFGKINCDIEPCICDLDLDGNVDDIDLLLFSEDYGRID